jgi:septum formation protein
MDTIILASKSPRRKEILTQIGIPFIQYSQDVDEDPAEKRSIRSAVIEIARRKANAASDPFSTGIVLGVDTVVYFNRSILGKPGTPAEARRFIKILSGNRHQVFSGITLKNITTGTYVSGCSVTNVQFRRLTSDEMDTYIESGEWRDKAGGYAVQGQAALFVVRLGGSFYNVMGLPVEELYRLLLKISYFESNGRYRPARRV